MPTYLDVPIIGSVSILDGDVISDGSGLIERAADGTWNYLSLEISLPTLEEEVQYLRGLVRMLALACCEQGIDVALALQLEADKDPSDDFSPEDLA